MEKMINGSTIHLALADYLATNAYINDSAQERMEDYEWMD